MKGIRLAMFIAAVFLPCCTLRAALFSSNVQLDQSFSQRIDFSTQVSGHPSGNMSRLQQYFITSGVVSASTTVDTVADTGEISGLDFKPFGLPADMRTSAIHFSDVVVDVPEDFPMPPVTHLETRSYRTTLTITDNSVATPTLESSSNAALSSLAYAKPWFVMFNELDLDLPSLIIHGTYEVAGPATTRSVPFSVEIAPVNDPVFVQRTGVRGGPSFNSGYPMTLSWDMLAEYRAVNPVVFDELVDGLRVRGSFMDRSMSIRLLSATPLPEAGTSTLLVAGMVVWSGIRRRRRD